MINSQAPSYLTSLVPQTVSQSSRYNLRNDRNLRNIYTRTSNYASSFLPSTIQEWNSLPIDVRFSPSLEVFKHKLNIGNPAPNKLYLVGERRLQVLHTRLRNSCSSLSHHLYLNHVIESPNCQCGSVESTEHYFFKCNMYNQIRRTLFHTISTISSFSINVILYGDNSKDFRTNKIIFLAVHKYINDSKRFAT